MTAAGNHHAIVLQLEAERARAVSAEQRLVIAQAIAAKLLTRCGLPLTVEWLEERVGSRLARDLVREQQSHADTRARLADALRQLEELQAAGR